MASNKEYRFKYEEEEPKIPVFTVLKNGAILKNIFIVNNNSPCSNPNPPPPSSQIPNQDNEEIVTVGRHPDSHIMLTHPSISRSHLHIRSNPSSHTLCVFDLGSTHGTWVCDERIEPRVRVQLKEGDTLRVGASTRVYRLHWIPLSRAYHFENPLASMDVAMAEEKEGGNGVAEEENSMESENCLGGESQEIQSLDSIVEEINSLFSDENLGSISGLNLEENAVTEHENAMEGYEDKKSFQIENTYVEEKDTFAVERKREELFESENSLGAEKNGEEIFESERSLGSERKGEEIFESENSLGAESQEIQSLDSIEEGLNSLFFDEDLGSVVKRTPSAPPMPENLVFTLYDENEELYESPLKDFCEQNEILRQRDEPLNFPLHIEGITLGSENPENDVEEFSSKGLEKEQEAEADLTADSPGKIENEIPFLDDPLNFPLHVEGITLESENPENDVEEFSSKGLEKEEEEEADLTAELPGKIENEIPFLDDHAKSEKISLPAEEVTGETGNQEIGIESLVPEPDCLLLSQSHQAKRESEADHPESEGLENEDQMVSLNHPFGEVSWEIGNQEVGIENLTLEPVCSLHLLSHQRKEENLTPEQKLSSVVNLNSVFLKEAEHPASEGLENEDQMVALNHPFGEIIGQTKSQEIGIEDLIPEPVHSLHSLSHQAKQESLTPEQKLSSVVDLNPAFLNVADHPSEGLENEDQIVSLNGHGKDGPIEYSAQSMTESVNLPLPGDEVFWEFTDDKENQTPQSLFAATCLPQVEKLSSVVDLYSACSNEADHPASEGLETNENQNVSMKDHEQKDVLVEYSAPFMTEYVNSSLPSEEDLLNITYNEENQTLQSLFAATHVPQVEKLSCMVNLNSTCYSEADHPASKGLEKNEDQNVFVEDHEHKDVLVEYSAPFMAESAKSSLPSKEDLLEITNDKENQTPRCHVSETKLPQLEKSSPEISDKMSSFGSIWSRRGKPASVLQIQTGRSGRKSKKDVVHAEVERHNEEDTKDKSISKELFSCLSEEEEEIFTPDKENFTPNTLILKSLKKMGKLEEVKHFESCRSSTSNITIRSNVHPEGHLSPDENNQTTGILKERKSVKPTSGNPVLLEQGSMVKKKRRPERVPFQSLSVNSASKTISEALGPKTATRSNASVNYTQTMVKKVSSPLSNNSVQDNNKRGWIMVVDTATLLDKKSRKYLELLQGLKGTHLIIPRMVLRELDCLKQRSRLFSRKTEASLVLEWIEECMVKTNWWVSVQSSEEDRRLTAPTPLAYPQSPFSDGSDGFTCGTRPLLSLRSIMEIVSPTAEDHILDCALLCRETQSDKQLVILSDDVLLKIKAMAEGLICEPVKEFRESLVNPFSERFLWTDSSPRGLTWSYLDDIILREKYNRCPLKNSSKGENAKGLKLILLHNSHYRQFTPIS
ncbi:FHA domain-containing protein PS1 isoform X3 [Ziziphus jujuba]|uniref:FHA domain-containing protein PS1 isoform X3 n=1 Tax=Ziziphus jujuba TaxID=326968 RepID=A0ABM3INT6_ZIZJJ|nr:FHA domain-containing protein PS1 isoform X3 [Ziziphus jujuba]